MITSWVGAEQYLALRIKAAFSRYKAGVYQASIVERAIPSAALSPFAPGHVIAILAVGIPASLVAQKRLWAGWPGLEIICRAIAGPASTEKRTAATPISLNFVMRSSFWFR
jgi:hypothetical protein